VRLPIGVQDFTKLREQQMLYVDKTMLMKPLIDGGTFFLARPRRFGKSLLLSTLTAVFLGRKDLFSNLWLENNHDFEPHPVIRLDFSNINFTSKPLDAGIVDWLRINALEYGYTLQSTNARDAFRELILELSKTAKVVILIDEYDKAITDYLFQPEVRSQNQAVLKSLYGVLKPLDSFLHLVLISGVSKIGKLSLFSDLNNLQDLTLQPDFTQICGYSKNEIEQHFIPWLEQVAVVQEESLEFIWQQIKFWYNGYSWDGLHFMYCPFSFLIFLTQKQFKSYWYETGTPTFLLEMIRNAQLNPLEFESFDVSEKILVATDIERLDPISIMFQTGYLTIKKQTQNIRGMQYQLAYPNEEVRQAFSSGLLLEYSQLLPHKIDQLGLELQRFLIDLDWTGFFATVNRTLASIPYEIFPAKESYVHSLVHIMLISTGFSTQSQVQTSLGRMDTLLETFDCSIIFEYKTSGSAAEALAQINEKNYAQGLKKPVIKIGVLFDLTQKQISDWAIG
jgi:hypothetical protein